MITDKLYLNFFSKPGNSFYEPHDVSIQEAKIPFFVFLFFQYVSFKIHFKITVRVSAFLSALHSNTIGFHGQHPYSYLWPHLLRKENSGV